MRFSLGSPATGRAAGDSPHVRRAATAAAAPVTLLAMAASMLLAGAGSGSAHETAGRSRPIAVPAAARNLHGNGTFGFTAHAGPNRLRFQGRTTATDGLSFTIVR